MNTPTSKDIKLDYLVDTIGKFRYIVTILILLCFGLGVGMVYVAADNRHLRFEVRKAFNVIKEQHQQIHESHNAIREQHTRITHKLKKLTKDE